MHTYSKISLSLLLVIIVSSCSSINAPRTSSTEGKERLYSDRYSSPFWVSDKFTGSYKRALTGSRLTFELDEKTGGVDTAVAGPDRPGLLVDDTHPNLAVCMKLDVQGQGHWWAGPKVSVNWRAMEEPNQGIWYENYIIDNASQNPKELEEWIFNIHKGKFIGTTHHDDSQYKHYLIHYKQWKQYYAVRQNYRRVGITSLKPILDKWRELGLENREFDGVKLNIEFHGPAKAKVVIDGYIPPSYSQVADKTNENWCNSNPSK